MWNTWELSYWLCRHGQNAQTTDRPLKSTIYVSHNLPKGVFPPGRSRAVVQQSKEITKRGVPTSGCWGIPNRGGA